MNNRKEKLEQLVAEAGPLIEAEDHRALRVLLEESGVLQRLLHVHLRDADQIVESLINVDVTTEGGRSEMTKRQILAKVYREFVETLLEYASTEPTEIQGE